MPKSDSESIAKLTSAAKLFLEGQRLALSAGLSRSLWRAGRKYALGSFIKPLNSPTRYLEYEWFLKMIAAEIMQDSVAKPCHALDVGSPKLFSLLMAEKLPIELVSVDIWDAAIKEARALYGGLAKEVRERVRLGVADIREELPEKLRPASGHFDLVFAMSVIEHIEPNPGGDLLALERMTRLVDSGGCVFVSVPVDSESREEYEEGSVYGRKGKEASSKVFFQRVYDTSTIRALVEVAAADGLHFEQSVLISWPEHAVFRAFWSIKNTTVRGLLGPTFPLLAPGFDISVSDAIPDIGSAGDLILKFRKR
jgi:SAM-dependent methyltransferase